MSILDKPEYAPERWLAQEAILMEARHCSTTGLHMKAVRLVDIARALGALTELQEKSAERIQALHDKYHQKKAA